MEKIATSDRVIRILTCLCPFCKICTYVGTKTIQKVLPKQEVVCGTLVKFQAVGNVTAKLNVFTILKRSFSLIPASITKTFQSGFSERRFAITKPAVPHPTITKSYVPYSTIIITKKCCIGHILVYTQYLLSCLMWADTLQHPRAVCCKILCTQVVDFLQIIQLHVIELLIVILLRIDY